MASATRLSVRLRPDLAEIERLADMVQDYAARQGWSPEVHNKVRLSIEELVANCVVHGCARGTCTWIAVDVRAGADDVIVRISDDGPPFDPLAAPDPSFDSPPDQRAIGGLGLFLVRHLMDSVSYQRENGTNSVRFRIRLQPVMPSPLDMAEMDNAVYKDDLRLAAACLVLEERGWKALLASTKPLCRAIAHKYNLMHEFDDLVADFMVKLLDGADGRIGALRRYDGSVKLNTYLAVVFGHMLIDRLRSIKAARLTDSDTPVEAVADRREAVQPSDSIQDCPEIDGLLHQAIGTLSDSDRRLLELYHFNKLKQREIATMLDCSIATVSRQLDRIHAVLRRVLLAHPAVMELVGNE